MKYTLHNGLEIPALGLGTWKSSSEDAYNAVLAAIKAGYRHIDTAMIYGNEEAIGKAIKDSGVKREELFITTKLWNSDQGYESALKAFETSLQKLDLDYIDLYLVHWFKGYDKSIQTWKALEEIYKSGKAKAIGVSNHNVHHIENIIKNGTVVPMVNQVETHIQLQNTFLHEYCESKGIKLEAYAPLMSWKIPEMLENETMIDIAKKHNKTVPQVAIRWLLERGIIVIPKSVNEKRISENFNVFNFALDTEDMTKIHSLNKGSKMFPEMDNVMF